MNQNLFDNLFDEQDLNGYTHRTILCTGVGSTAWVGSLLCTVKSGAVSIPKSASLIIAILAAGAGVYFATKREPLRRKKQVSIAIDEDGFAQKAAFKTALQAEQTREMLETCLKKGG